MVKYDPLGHKGHKMNDLKTTMIMVMFRGNIILGLSLVHALCLRLHLRQTLRMGSMATNDGVHT